VRHRAIILFDRARSIAIEVKDLGHKTRSKTWEARIDDPFRPLFELN